MHASDIVYLQERAGRPEQLDASVMANPDYVNTANTDHRYNILLAGESTQSQAAPVFHVPHPFPLSAVASQLPVTAFSRSPNADYRPPTLTVPANPVNVYDGGFNPASFSQQFPGEVFNDQNGPSAANSYQMNVEAIHSLFPVIRPMCAGNSPKFYTSGQPACYPPPSSTFMSRADGAGFACQLQSLTVSSSSQPWPPPPAFGQLSRFPLAPNEASVDDFCGSILQNSAVGSDSLSSGSPVSELLDHGSSPTQLRGATYGCAVTLPSPSMSNLVESARRTIATSPFCPSPVDGLQLSRSLPTGVRFGLHSGSSVADAAVVGHHHPASRMRFDSMSATSPASQRSFFQPGSVLGGLEDRAVPGATSQVISLYSSSYFDFEPTGFQSTGATESISVRREREITYCIHRSEH